MADPKDIKAIFKAMVEHGIAEVEMEAGGEKIIIRRLLESPALSAPSTPLAPSQGSSDPPVMTS